MNNVGGIGAVSLARVDVHEIGAGGMKMFRHFIWLLNIALLLASSVVATAGQAATHHRRPPSHEVKREPRKAEPRQERKTQRPTERKVERAKTHVVSQSKQKRLERKVSAGKPPHFENGKLRERHFKKHAADFKSRTPQHYEQQARNFMGGSPKPGTLQAVRPKGMYQGEIVRYNPRTREFGVMKPNGTIKTYFKPDPAIHKQGTNMKYFQKEARKTK